MAIDIGFDTVGGYYSWADVRNFGWKWNGTEPVNKTWRTFIQLNWDLTVTRDLNIVEVGGYSIFKYPEQSIGITDGDELTFSVSQAVQEFLSVADEHQISEFIKGLSESVDFSEDEVRDVAKRLSEIASVTDNLSVTMTKRMAEAIHASESFDRVLEYIREFNRSIGVTESDHRDITINKEGLFAIADERPSFDMKFYLDETYGIDSDWDREWIAFVLAISTFQIAESTAADYTKKLFQAFDIDSSSHREMTLYFADSFSIASDVATTVIFNLFFQRSISVQEAVDKTIRLSLQDRFRILDEIIRGGGEGIISDLRVLKKALTDSEFEELIRQTSPTGYGPFVPFIAGDYEYQEALYKVVLKARDLSRPYINQIRYEVDLPDLFDKGTVVLTATRTNVPFTKNFNPDEPPTLTVVVKAGSSGFVPEVDFDIRPDNKSFDVELRDPSNPSNLVAGTISWKAQGF